MHRQRSVLFCGPASEVWGCQGSPHGMPQDGLDTTMATPEMLLVWQHVDAEIIAELEVRVAMSRRMTSKGGGDERWGSKPKKSEVAEATKMIRRF